MSLTFSAGPLSGHPPETVNYRIEGPAHKLLMHEFPRRIRAVFGGETVVDTTRAVLLHETGLPPQVYVPVEDIRADLIQPTDHHTYCPFKGTASYWTVTAAQQGQQSQQAENAIWSYPDPNRGGQLARRLRRLLLGRDGRVVRRGRAGRGPPARPVPPRRRAPVAHGTSASASTTATRCWPRPRSPLLLSETGLPNRFYIPAGDVRQDLLEPSDTHTHCPYKGTASYWSVNADDRKLTDAVLVLPAGRGRLGRGQRVPVLPARRPDRRGRRARELAPRAVRPKERQTAGHRTNTAARRPQRKGQQGKA